MMNGLHHFKVPSHVSSTALRNQHSYGDIAPREVQSTNLGSQERISSLPIPVPPETSTPTSITNSNYQGSCITTEFPGLGQQEGQQASQVKQISTKLRQGTHAHDLVAHLCFSV